MASCSDGPCSSGVGTTSGKAPSDQYDAPPGERDTLKAEEEGEEEEAGEEEAPMTCMDEECQFKPPTPCPPVVDLRGREVIFAIAVFFLFSVSIGLIVILATTKLSENKPGSRPHVNSGAGPPALCLSRACLARAAYMLDTMDARADPCTDFWQYSCGGWLSRAIIPPFNKAWSVDHEIDVRIKVDIRRKVDGPITKDTTQSVDRKVKTLYRKCMDVDAIDGLGRSPVVDIMDSMGGWALNADWNIGTKSGLWNFQRALEELHFTYWRDCFFVVWVGADHKQSTKNIIQVDQAGLGMEAQEAYLFNDSHPDVVRYKQYMRDVAALFTSSQTDIDQFVETTFNFEKQLAQIMVPMEHESRRDPAAMYNPVTIEELQALSPWIDWLQFFRRNFTDVTKDTVVVVTNKDYMANMSKLIETSHPRTQNYYLMWRLISNFANILSKPFRQAALRYEGTSKGSGREEERWRTCLGVLDEWLGMAVGSLYVQDNFPRGSRDEVIAIIGHVRDRFKRRLARIDWMDAPTRRHALRKVDRMVYKIGYPEFLLNVSKVERFYRHFHISENDTFFQANLNGIYYEIKKMVDKLKIPPSKEDWEMNPQAVNAYYAATENQMVFPAGILQLPYYSTGVPRYVNFGSIGSTIGHEMIHGFDVFGSLYDASGNLNRWWSDTSWANFENRTRCIADFYSTFTIQGLPVNGDLTLGENIADIGGITQAFEAYKALEKQAGEEPAMPGLGLNNYQVFFLAYGQNWCIKRTRDSLREATRGSAHAPGQIRVNGTLSQVPEFAKAFGCRTGLAPMAPRRRCSVW